MTPTSDGIPVVVDTHDALQQAVADLAAADGPIGVDAERAGSYRYSQRAYLIQVFRPGAPVLLLDPLPLTDLSALSEVLDTAEWVMQAAHNDLDCLAEIGLAPTALFDTELAAQLLGMERIGLASLVESELGRTMRKSHGQADWSRRPLRRSWLDYAALDVEVLPELRESLAEKLTAAEKTTWAAQEFGHQMRRREPADPDQRWRRTNSAGRLRNDTQRGILRALWFHRDELARRRDVAVHRILRDQAMVDIAKAVPRDREQLRAAGDLPDSVLRRSDEWLAVVASGIAEPVGPLRRTDGPPARTLKAWEQRDPQAAVRWVALRQSVTERAEELEVWTQTLLAPDVVADLAWHDPEDPVVRLHELGARPWQIEHTADLF
ncbi:MAG: HRDC domain-containing protein [Candidatus Nanopelagicales bacterium]|nr:HRDC domain-containing protein [Candidatus Nanopelagicales bacterium]MCU0295118.1 HRDC domain-containing protein [Candidatus Nanopelagicales bacterium]MCU0298494.1 HRDC domain-containing protein [Candidatus Nanopelagicales bacterium]